MGKFSEYFSNNAERFVQELSELVAINSVKGEAKEGAPYGEAPRAVLQKAYDIACGHGFDAEILGDRVLRVEYGEGEAKLAILAHLDIVPAGDGWTVSDPFVLKKDGDMLYGRGVADDKGAALAALYALKYMKEHDVKLSGKVQVIMGTDEENGSSDVAWYVENVGMPKMVFTPDGQFPVVNTEKGRTLIGFTAPFKAVEGPAVVSVKGGTVVNAVPAVCEAVVQYVPEETLIAAENYLSFLNVRYSFEAIDDIRTRISCRGLAAHAAYPEKGINAATALLRFLMALPIDIGPMEQLAKVLPFGDNYGETVGAAAEDDVSGKLTVNLGLIKYDENGLDATIDCRVPVATTGVKVWECFKAAAAPVNVELRANSNPHHVPGDSEFVQTLMNIYREYTGLDGEPIAIGGGTYVHEIDGGVAFGCQLPGTECHMHEPDECMALADLLLGAEMDLAACLELLK